MTGYDDMDKTEARRVLGALDNGDEWQPVHDTAAAVLGLRADNYRARPDGMEGCEYWSKAWRGRVTEASDLRAAVEETMPEDAVGFRADDARGGDPMSTGPYYVPQPDAFGFSYVDAGLRVHVFIERVGERSIDVVTTTDFTEANTSGVGDTVVSADDVVASVRAEGIPVSEERCAAIVRWWLRE